MSFNVKKKHMVLAFEVAIDRYVWPSLSRKSFAREPALEFHATFRSKLTNAAIAYECGGSFEIETSFKLNVAPFLECSLADVLHLNAPYESGGSSFFQASSPDRLSFCMKQIGQMLDMYCTKILDGEATVFQEVLAARAMRAEQYTREVMVRPILQAAGEAWGRKDFSKARELYLSVAKYLTPQDRRRLEYATKVVGRVIGP